MTAITFPLDKFPGQVHHNNIGFPGHISAHPIVLGLLFLTHLSLAITKGVSPLILSISLTPYLFVVSFFSVYYIKFSKRDHDYFGLSFEELESVFEVDRLFFKKMFSVELVLLVIVWIVGLMYPSIPMLSYLIVNSILMITVFFRTTIKGIYSRNNILSVLFTAFVVETVYWSLLPYIPLLDFVVGSIGFVVYYNTLTKYESYKPIQLLQKIIT